MKRLLYVLGVLLMGCNGQQISDVPVAAFDLSSAKLMKMSDFVDSITLIPLETNDSSLIRNVREFSIVGTSLFVKDGNSLLIFDGEGNFINSTHHLQGGGPLDYYSAVSFTWHPDGGLEIFDAARYRMIKYDNGLRYVTHCNLSKDILPASGCIYIYRKTIDCFLIKVC